MFLKNITNFSNTSDYLPIFNAALITDLVVIFMSITGIIKSKTLKEWYRLYGLSAVIADILSIFIGIIAARFIYSALFTGYNLFIFILVALGFQLFHDLTFAWFFNSLERGKSRILDTFKDYAKEMGYQILIADAQMIISTILLGSFFAGLDTNTNIIISVVFIYIMPYLLYSI